MPGTQSLVQGFIPLQTTVPCSHLNSLFRPKAFPAAGKHILQALDRYKERGLAHRHLWGSP